MICRKEQEADPAVNQSEARTGCRYSRDKTSLFIKPKCNRTLTTEVCKVTLEQKKSRMFQDVSSKFYFMSENSSTFFFFAN